MNKIDYLLSEFLNDPDAAAHVKEQADQKAQDEETKKRLEEANAKAEEDANTKSEEDAKAAELVDRSEFKPKRAAGNIARGIVADFIFFSIICIMLYAGHIESNRAIGYNLPFRIVSFIYGSLAFFYVIPRMLYEKYWLKIPQIIYATVPIIAHNQATHVNEYLATVMYSEDSSVSEARKAVESLYSEAFRKSLTKDKAP